MLHGRIPEEFTIPKFHGPSGIRELDDNSLLLLKPNKVGRLKVEGEDGEFEVKSKEGTPKLFPHKFNWTFSRLSEIECFGRFFNTSQLFDLKQVHMLEFNGYQLHWIIGTDKIRLQEGSNTRTSKYLINVAHWLYKDFYIHDLDTLKMVVDKLLILNSIIPLNITSPASTTKDLILGATKGEFSLYNKIPLEITKFIHSCYVGPRMESKCLGTIDGVDNKDLVKAYLRAFAKCPSLAKGSILKIVGGKEFHPDAHPGSGYEIKVKIPDTYSQFAPIPLRIGGYTPHPHGEFVTKVSKPYIDKLNELGNIPYEILDSRQIIMWGKPNYPFAQLAKDIEDFENQYSDYFYPINLKNLHYPIIGHMLQIHKNIDIKDGHIWYESSQDYNPINACAIQGMVANELWGFSQMHNTEAIRVDALSGYNLSKKDGYKDEPSGLMTFLTPGLKDKPGSTLYRDLITRDRDLPSIKIHFPLRIGISKSYGHPNRIGRLENFTAEIPPQGGSRTGKDIGVKHVGELLDRRIKLPIMVIDEESRLTTDDFPYWRSVGWIDDYLRLFPQTQT